jgi:hypothetical protein
VNHDTKFDDLSRALAGTTSRRQAFKLLGGGLAGGALASVGFAAVNTAVAQRPVTGTATGVEDGGLNLGAVTGLVAELTSNGILISGTSALEGAFSAILDVAGSAQESSCDILFLDLLGLEVTIVAVPGAGNLLGNLLCAVAGLLDNGGPLQGIVGLLNNIFRSLG